MIERIPLDAMNSDQLDALYTRAEQAEAAIERTLAAVRVVDRDDVTDWQRGYRACSTMARAALTEQPAPAATQATEPTPPADPDDTLVVDRYRTDRGDHAWCFRCWGTDTCDGALSLDHSSRESAERARDRHVAEEHTQPATPIKEQS
jgi:hypothetical protein